MRRRWMWGVLSAGPALALLAATRTQYARPAITGYAAEYTVQLTSDWPTYLNESTACNNDGDERLEGTVLRVADGHYRGRFTRATTLDFCGAHGRHQSTPCALHLQGRDSVDVDAVAIGNEQQPVLLVRWYNVPGTSTVSADGTCSAVFKETMAQMYTGVVREVEMPVGAEVLGAGDRRLADYPWVAAVTLPRATDSPGLPNNRQDADR